VRALLPRPDEDRGLVGAADVRGRVVGRRGAEVQGKAAEGEDGGPLVDGGAEDVLLGRHVAVGTEHATHLVDERAAEVGVEVDERQPVYGEVEDETSVVEIAGGPSCGGEGDVGVEELVDDGDVALGRQGREAAVRGGGVGPVFAGCPNQLSGRPVVHECWTVACLHDVAQPGQ